MAIHMKLVEFHFGNLPLVPQVFCQPLAVQLDRPEFGWLSDIPMWPVVVPGPPGHPCDFRICLTFNRDIVDTYMTKGFCGLNSSFRRGFDYDCPDQTPAAATLLLARKIVGPLRGTRKIRTLLGLLMRTLLGLLVVSILTAALYELATGRPLNLPPVDQLRLGPLAEAVRAKRRLNQELNDTQETPRLRSFSAGTEFPDSPQNDLSNSTAKAPVLKERFQRLAHPVIISGTPGEKIPRSRALVAPIYEDDSDCGLSDTSSVRSTSDSESGAL